VVSLGVEAAEPPLSLRRQQILLHYASKLAGLPDNPAMFVEHDQVSGRALRNFGDFADRLQQCCTDIDFHMPRIVPYGFLSVPPGIVPLLPCNYNLAAFKRASTLPAIYHQGSRPSSGIIPTTLPFTL